MSNTVAFADFGKESNDLILKGFPTSGFKVIAETQTPNSIAIKTTVAGPEKLSLAVQPTFNLPEYKCVTLKADYSTSALEGTLSLADLGTKGTKLEFSAKRDAEDKRSASANFSFVNETINFKATGTKPLSTDPASVNVDAVGQFPEKVYWGLNVKYATKKDLEFNARLQMVAPDDTYTIGVLLDHKKDKSWDLSWLWYQRITSAVKYSWSFVTNSKANTNPSCAVAGEYKLDEVSIVRGKVSVAKPAENADPNLRVALALNQNLSTHTTVTVGADINASTLLGLKGGPDHAIGFEVKLK